MDSGDDEGILSSLPKTRPQRRSPRRDAAKARASADSSPAAGAPPAAAAKSRRQSTSKPKGAGPKATRKVQPTAAPRDERPQAQRSGPALPPSDARGPVAPPSGSEVVEAALASAAELAQVGLKAGEQLLRSALGRLPRL